MVPTRPIFVVGCQRSGTTLLRLMLDSHPNISCGPETRFLGDLAAVTGDNWDRMRHYGFPKEYWHTKFAEMFASIQSDYAASRGKTRWADKTPRYAMSLQFIDDLFPTSQIVHVIRDGRDVVASHRDRWGWVAAAKAVEKWPRYVQAARAVGTKLPPDRYLEIRYEDLVGETEKTLRGLLDWLGEAWDEAVMAHDQHPHDVHERYAEFSAARREADGTGSAVYRTRVGAHAKEAGPLLGLLFRLRSQRVLRSLGYS